MMACALCGSTRAQLDGSAKRGYVCYDRSGCQRRRQRAAGIMPKRYRHVRPGYDDHPARNHWTYAYPHCQSCGADIEEVSANG